MVLLWAGATVITGGLAWSAVQVAGAQTSPDAVRPLSADEVSALPGAVTPPAVPDRAVASTLPGLDTSADTLAAPTVASPAPPTSATPSSTSTATTTVPAGSAATTTSPASTTGIYHLVRGSVGVAANGNSIEFLWATPNSGFQVEVKSVGPEQVEVEFEGSNHKSDIKVTVNGGVLRPEINEEQHNEDE